MFNKKIKALTFDTGGTILDWHSGFKKGFEDLKKKYNLDYNSEEMANLMRKKSLFTVTNQNKLNLVNFDQAHKIAVHEIIKDYELSFNEDEIFFLHNTIPSQLKTWNDFNGPFETLKENYICVSFTLLSNRLVFSNSRFNNINWDLILSCETLEVYKPDIEAYTKVSKLLQLNPSECAMVACHSFDLNAAQKAGFKTIFVKRQSEWGKGTNINVDGNYDLVVESFEELRSILY